MKKYFSIFLSALLVCTCCFAACNDNNSSSSNGNETEDNRGTVEFDSTQYLVKDSKTDYKIVLPSETDMELELAGAEMVEFFGKATGCDVSVESASSYTYTPNEKFISIGQTNLLEQANVQLDAQELQTSGYVVKTVGKSIFIAGNESRGSLYGVYQFLESLFDFKVYADDEIYYVEKSTIPLPKFDIQYSPTIDMHVSPTPILWSNAVLGYRLKMISWDSQFMRINGSNMDAALQLARPSTYLEGHKLSDYPNNWYLDDEGTDLCFSNQDLWKVMVENAKPYILANPTYTKLLLGQQDNKWWCSCERCTSLIEQYGTNVSTAILMANYIETELNKWLATVGDSRTLQIGVFAYQYTKEPPVSYDEDTDTYTAKIKTNPNVFILYAPIELDRTLPTTHEKNKAFAGMIRAWGSCTDNLYIWGYSTNFGNWMVDFPNWESTYYNYDFYKSCNVKLLYDQGPSGSSLADASTWMDLRHFLHGQLAFDSSLKMQELIDEWFTHYFKVAKSAMYQYFSEMRDLEQYNIEFNGMFAQGTGMVQQKYWPKASILRWKGYIEEAWQSIESLKTSDPALHARLWKRINKEYLSIQYILISLYSDIFTEQELLAEKLYFKKYTMEYGIGLFGEGAGRSMVDLYKTWGV